MKATARLPHATLEYGCHAELAADVPYVRILSLERERRSTRRDLKPLHAGEGRNQLLRHAIAEVFVCGVAAHVHEWQHGHRSRFPVESGCAPGGAKTMSQAPRCRERDRDQRGQDRGRPPPSALHSARARRERGDERANGGETVSRCLPERVCDGGFHGRRDLAYGAQVRDRFGQPLGDDGLRGRASVRRLPGEHLVQHAR